MSFLFENILTSDSETYRVILKGKDIGCVFQDKDKGCWAAICPNSQSIEDVFLDRISAAQYLVNNC